MILVPGQNQSFLQGSEASGVLTGPRGGNAQKPAKSRFGWKRAQNVGPSRKAPSKPIPELERIDKGLSNSRITLEAPPWFWAKFGDFWRSLKPVESLLVHRGKFPKTSKIEFLAENELWISAQVGRRLPNNFRNLKGSIIVFQIPEWLWRRLPVSEPNLRLF